MNEFLCELFFNHPMSKISVEDGQGEEFRYVETCRCGKKTETSNWVTTVNQQSVKAVS